MLANVGLLVLGVVALYFGAEWLVRGAAGLARMLGVSPLVVGLTVVSYGTSAPELAVSTVAALDGKSDIALGNVVGSNIANIGLILGITALIAPPLVQGSLLRRELPVLLLATAAIPVFLMGGEIHRWEGILLVLGALLFTIATLKWSGRASPESEELPDVPEAGGSKIGLALLSLLGLGVLLVGGKVFVTGAVGMALQLGMSERVVGLTVVAVGTSLPELAASLVAAMRGHSEIAVGNVVGSNIFNVLLILGTASALRPITGDLSAMRLDLAVVGLLTVLCVISMRAQRRIPRWEGGVFLAIYVSFLALLVAGVG
ncbi:MAG: calcium/sodium antiporter [Myxococcales bacterium]|nr:calcium/sodium antiporter [Myxococcales bacterium]MCB9576857.1 calcium/sodium antiporter [Polyangiaceae bacterium]